ncbi:hypothetical protein B0H11DRAFT_1802506 [Mycena galericulata]|nr:hypothetical protein B0H11DRAFT_1802506 [Mycena galericulata]
MDDSEPQPPKRVEDLWFEDGNIVVQAENSQFRVYRGVLAARSTVFQNMLSFPQPPELELVEGCPLVRLHDYATEVTAFLKAIFEPEFFMPFPVRTDLETIIGCLRLSHKYGVDYLRRRALIHLSSAYDTDLSRWDRMATFVPNDNGSNLPALDIKSFPWPDHRVRTDLLCIIQLARETDALWILPDAFYNLSAAFSQVGKHIFHGGVFHGVPTGLSIQDQEAFLTGHDIQTRSKEAILRFLSDPLKIDGCVSPARCWGLRLAAIRLGWGDFQNRPSDPLCLWESDDWHLLHDLCPACITLLRLHHNTARQKFWDNLPKIYGLPPWEELEKMKVAAIGTDYFG